MKKTLVLTEFKNDVHIWYMTNSLVRNTQELFLEGFEYEGRRIKNFVINTIDHVYQEKDDTWQVEVEVEFE